MAPEGVAVGAAMIPVLVGGVIGAGVGTMLLYGGENASLLDWTAMRHPIGFIVCSGSR